jgi:LysR family glycine cleavage system transcriptional activator
MFMRRLPPLNALRAFEAAGRLGSMIAAADELSVTPAAISHQVKTLEEYLGVELFHRKVRAIELSETGAGLLPWLRDGFDSMAEGCNRLVDKRDNAPLVISSAPAFAGKWLMPNLADFNRLHPEITLRLDGTLSVIDFTRDNDVDAALRFGQGPYPGLHADLLSYESVVVVCSPALRDGDPPLVVPSDLKHHTLIHMDWFAAPGTQPDWSMWLKLANIDGIDSTKGPMVTSDSLAVDAAVNNVGVAMVSEFLIERELATGRLVKPFDLVLTSEFCYWFVCPPDHLERPRVAAFRAWLLDTLAKDPAVRHQE